MAHVVIVDRDGDSRELYAEVLRSHGHRVNLFDNAEEGYRAAQDADALVTGIGLSGAIDGIAFVRALRESGATRLPIVVVSAYAQDIDRQRAREAGCDRFLPKPCLPEQLVSGLEDAIRDRGQHS